jgi:hypothetical protein
LVHHHFGYIDIVHDGSIPHMAHGNIGQKVLTCYSTLWYDRGRQDIHHRRKRMNIVEAFFRNLTLPEYRWYTTGNVPDLSERGRGTLLVQQVTGRDVLVVMEGPRA